MKRIGYILGLSFLIQSGFCGTTKYDEMFKDKLKISDIVVMHKGGSIFDITTPDKKVTTCDISNWNNPGSCPISVTKNKGFDICSIKNGKDDVVSFCWWNNALTVLSSSYHGNVAVKADNVCILHNNKFNNFYAQGKTISNQGNLGAEKEITLFAPQMSLTGNTETDSNIWDSNYKWRMVSNSVSALDVYPGYNNSGYAKGQSIHVENVDNFYNDRLGIGWMDAKEVTVDGEDYLHYAHRWNDAMGDVAQVRQQLSGLSWPNKIHDQKLVNTAKETINIMRNGGNTTFQLPQNSYCKSVFIDQNLQSSINNDVPKPNKKKCNINNSHYSVTNEDSFEASNGYNNPLVMNLANAFRPGGGFLMGSHAQEESLCRSSTLYASLLSNKSKYHDYNRDLRENTKKIYHNRGGLFGLDRMLISPWVYVFRDSNYQLIDPYRVAVVTIAAPDLGDGDGGKRHTGEAYTAIQHRVTNQTKMRNAILKQLKDMIITAAYYGYKNLVLGAFGCGAFAQDPHVIAQIYYEILVNEGYGSYFDNIKFSVKGHDARACRLRDAFNFVFQTGKPLESNVNNMETINNSQLVDYIALKNRYFLEKSKSGNKYLMVHAGHRNYRHTTVTEKLNILQQLGGNMEYGGIQSIDDQIAELLKKKGFNWNKTVIQSASDGQLIKRHNFSEYDKHKYLGSIDHKHPGRIYVLERKLRKCKGGQVKQIFAMAFDRTKTGKSCLREIGDDEKQVVLDHLHSIWTYKHNNQEFNHKAASVGGKIAELASAIYSW